MKKNLLLLLALPLILNVEKTNAQDIHFSQFYETSILRNPALTGIFSGDYKAGINYRTQWSSISVPFQTVLASAETRVLVNREVGDYLSFGICTSFDRAGSISFNSYQVYPAVNFNKAIEDNHNSYLSVGFAAGYIQRSFDLTKATFASQYTGGSYNATNATGENITNVSIQNYDLAAGLSYNSSAGPNNMINYYIGAAGYHITKPRHVFNGQDQLVRLNMKYTASLGVKCNLNEQYGFLLHGNYTLQSPYREFIGGGLVSWKAPDTHNLLFTLYGGVFVRYNDAIIPTLKLDYQQYTFVTSYDVNTSKLRPASNGLGGFEMSVYVRGTSKKSKKIDYSTNCPRFENMLPGKVTGW